MRKSVPSMDSLHGLPLSCLNLFANKIYQNKINIVSYQKKQKIVHGYELTTWSVLLAIASIILQTYKRNVFAETPAIFALTSLELHCWNSNIQSKYRGLCLVCNS